MTTAKTEFYYCGKVRTTNGKTAFGFISVKLHDDIMTSGLRDAGISKEVDRRTSWFTLKKAPAQSVGAIYVFKECEVDEKGTLTRYVGEARYLKAGQSPLTAHWQQHSRDAEDAKHLASAEKKAVNDKELARALDTLRDRYNKIPYPSRRAFKLWLWDQIG